MQQPVKEECGSEECVSETVLAGLYTDREVQGAVLGPRDAFAHHASEHELSDAGCKLKPTSRTRSEHALRECCVRLSRIPGLEAPLGVTYPPTTNTSLQDSAEIHPCVYDTCGITGDDDELERIFFKFCSEKGLDRELVDLAKVKAQSTLPRKMQPPKLQRISRCKPQRSAGSAVRITFNVSCSSLIVNSNRV